MIEIKNGIYWNGVIDWELREFHGHEYSTPRGSSYNSYIIKDEKTVLVDTVWYPYEKEYLAKLDKEVGVDNIDMIIINHMEPDHGGSLGVIMERNPNIPIYCSKNGVEIIKKHFHDNNWNFNVVKTGDTIKTGKFEIVFVEMTMLHWPDSLAEFVKGPNVLLSNDAFGQHYATSTLFNDVSDECEIYQEAIKYYANILAPFNPLIKKKVEEIRALNLPIEMIAPSHGAIWRKNPTQIIDKYYEWSQNYNDGSVVIVYDTMYDSTKRMADAIGQGLDNKGISYRLFNASVSDHTDLLTQIFKAKGVIVGSCTVNNGLLTSIAALLEETKYLKFKGKNAAAFGSFGWSGEAQKIINQKLQDAGFNVVAEPIAVKYRPTEDELIACIEYGEKFAESMK